MTCSACPKHKETNLKSSEPLDEKPTKKKHVDEVVLSV